MRFQSKPEFSQDTSFRETEFMFFFFFFFSLGLSSFFICSFQSAPESKALTRDEEMQKRQQSSFSL